MKKLLGIFFLMSVISCSKEERTTNTENDKKPAASVIPSINLVSVSPTTAAEFKDSIIFNLYYKDGDGDIGFEEADSNSLYLTDTRKNLTEEYHLVPVAPAGKSISVEGNFRIVLPHTIIFDSAATTENTTFTLWIRDRKGHKSNTVTSPQITIKR